jgi:hypothetical protein
MYHDFNYPAVLLAGSRATWRIEDVLPEGATLDFGKPFMPEALARIAALPGLTDAERLTLNHIRGHEYLSIFRLVEEFILPFVLDDVRSDLAGDDRVRAMLQFAAEEAKHIQLFRRFQAAFAAGFGTECSVIGPAEAIAAEVLRHHPLSVALLVLQIEWMTQSHYLGSVRDDGAIDPLFASLLRHHWIEEAQHTKLDTLMVEALAARMGADEIDGALEGYLELGGFFDAGFRTQAELNFAALERAVGRTLDSETRDAVIASQHQALRWTYLGSGMTHPNFGATLDAISPTARAKVDAVAPQFC